MKTTICLVIILLLCVAVHAMATPVSTEYKLNNDPAAPSSEHSPSDVPLAPGVNDNGYGFNYESLVQSPGGGATQWWYDYYLENNSLDHNITSWTWGHGSHVFAVMPNAHSGTIWFGNSWPLDASASPSPDDTAYHEESYYDKLALTQVMSTLKWEDGHTQDVGIFVPVPEPCSMLILGLGAAGLFIRRKR